MSSRLNSRFKRGLRALFEAGQRARVDILPRHFYSQIPDIAALRREQQWRRPYSMHGVAGADLESQLEFARRCSPPELRAVIGAGEVYRGACARNGAVGYGPIEADFLYTFACTHRPAKVVQVGCGVSTAVLLRASEDAGFPLELVCVDPYPTEFLKGRAQAGVLDLIEDRVQNVNLDILTGSGDGDLLFVDSTHTVKPGSDVNRLVLEILPRLAKGTYVHFHDILFPYDYSPGILEDDLFFWSETVLLQSFLTGNPRFAIRASLSMLHHERSNDLRALMPNYRPQPQVDGLAAPGTKDGGHFPSSVYLQVIS